MCHTIPLFLLSPKIILEAELARKTFYRNFTSKNDVLNSYIDGVILEYTQALTTNPDDPLSVIFGFCENKRKMLKLLDKNWISESP